MIPTFMTGNEIKKDPISSDRCNHLKRVEMEFIGSSIQFLFFLQFLSVLRIVGNYIIRKGARTTLLM